MKKNLTLICMVTMACFLLAGCSNEPKQDSNPKEIIQDRAYDTSEQCTAPTYFMSNIEDYVKGALTKRFTNIVGSLSDAKVVIMSSEDYASHGAELAEFVKNGGILVDVTPNDSQHAAWAEEYGIFSAMDNNGDGETDLLLYACHNGDVYQVDDIESDEEISVIASKHSAENAEYVEAADEEEQIDEIVSEKIVAYGQTTECANILLNGFISWVNSELQESVSTSEFNSIVDQIDLNKNITTIHHQVNVNFVDYFICKISGSTADKITASGTIDVAFQIVPYYAYQGDVNPAGTGGDYYIVNMIVTARNGQLYNSNGWCFKHGAFYTHIFGVYMNRLDVSAQLVSSANKSVSNVVFEKGTPIPQSTQSSITHTSGFSGTFNIAGTVALDTKLVISGSVSMGGTFTWSNSTTETLGDVSIAMTTDNNSMVRYVYQTNNLKKVDGAEGMPIISRSDEVVNSTWCWHKTDAKDDDVATSYKIKVDIDPIYGVNRRYAHWKYSGHIQELTGGVAEKTFYLSLPMPKRTRLGEIDLKSTNSNYVAKLVYTDSNGKTYTPEGSAYEKNTEVKYLLPIGTYRVDYEIHDGDTGELLGAYYIPDLKVLTAKSTSISTLDGIKK